MNKVEFSCTELTMSNLLADFKHIHNAVKDTHMSGTTMDIDDNAPGYTGVPSYVERSSKRL